MKWKIEIQFSMFVCFFVLVPLVHDVKVKVNALAAVGDALQQNDVVKDAVDSFVPHVAQAVQTVKKPEKIRLEKGLKREILNEFILNYGLISC